MKYNIYVVEGFDDTHRLIATIEADTAKQAREVFLEEYAVIKKVV